MVHRMSWRDLREQERKKRRARRIWAQKAARGRKRREERFLRLRGKTPKKEKPVENKADIEEQKRAVQSRGRSRLARTHDEDLAPDDPMSQTIAEGAGPLYYTPLDKPPEGTVDPIDRLVTEFTGRMWSKAEEIRPSTKPLSYEEQRYRMRKRGLPDLPLAMKRAQLGALNIGIGALESFTFPARPSAWGRTAESLVGLATSRERRREAMEFAQARPEAVGLQLLGGAAGGYAAGRVIGRLRGPSTYTLKQKTGPLKLKDVKNPATQLARGKWRSTWEITRKGGTAVVQLKDRLGYVTYYEPTPVFDFSRIGLIGLSGIHARPIETIKSDTVEKQATQQLQRVRFGQRQRLREPRVFTTDDLLEERQKQIITPILRPLPRLTQPPQPLPIIEPIAVQRQRQRLGFRPIQIQKQVLKQYPVPVLTMKTTLKSAPFDPLRFDYRKKGKRRKTRKERGFGILEVRIDPLKMKGVKKKGSSLKEVLKF